MEYVRIAILSPYDVFLGAMDNEAEDSLHYYDDELIEYLKGTASTFSCKVNAQHEDSRHLVEGNKLSFRYQNKDYYLNIMHVERDKYEVYIEAYTLSFELLNEKRSAYKASTAMSFEEYLEVFDPEHVVSLGLNEVSDKKIIHEWTGEETILGRLFSLATVFSAELEFLPRLNDNYSLKQIVMNAYKEHSDTVQGVGRDRTDLVLRYNKQISGIKKTSDITELYTAITPTGRDGLTLASLDKTEYDSEGNVEYRKPAGSTHLYAVQARDRFPSNLMAAENERYIGVDWEYDTDNVNTLYGQALAQLKKNCVPQVSYEVEGYFDTGIGDTVIIADEDFNPELYLQARVTEQHRSFTDPTQNKTTFDNFKELQSQIDASLLSRVEDLIKQNKTYTAMISTNNGIVFRNGIGETTMTAHVRDAGGVELAENYEIHWYKDGSEAYIGNPYTISAEDVDSKAVYRFEAVDTSGVVKAFYEVTVSDVNDGKDGDPGEDGKSSYIHIRYSAVSNPTSSSQISTIPNKYIGIQVSQNPVASTNPADYTWAQFTGDPGATGARGPAGPDGKTPYIHFAYANSADGQTDFSITESAGRSYMGQYADYTEADSTDPADYTWIKTKGENGSDGPPTGITVSETEPEDPYTGMLWKHTGTVSGLIKNAVYRWDGTEWDLFLFTAENIDVQTLSAITANLGYVTAGSIVIPWEITGQPQVRIVGTTQMSASEGGNNPIIITYTEYSKESGEEVSRGIVKMDYDGFDIRVTLPDGTVRSSQLTYAGLHFGDGTGFTGIEKSDLEKFFTGFYPGGTFSGDLNALITPGMYSCDFSNIVNGHYASGRGWVEVTRSSEANVIQKIYRFPSGGIDEIAIRLLTNNQWGNWFFIPINGDNQWNNISLSSGYVTAEGNTPQYRISGNRVELRGQVARSSGTFGTSTVAIGYLPSDCYPAKTEMFHQADDTYYGARVAITTSGQIRVNSRGDSGYVSLSGIYFYI